VHPRRPARALLPTDEADVSVTGRLAVGRLPRSGSLVVDVVARATGSGAYLGSVIIGADGTAHAQLRAIVNGRARNISARVALSRPVRPAVRLAFRLVVHGDRLSFRVWPSLEREPARWLVVARDGGIRGAGSAGLRVSSLAATGHRPSPVALDRFVVRRR
jgi:hypothetical protein